MGIVAHAQGPWTRVSTGRAVRLAGAALWTAWALGACVSPAAAQEPVVPEGKAEIDSPATLEGNALFDRLQQRFANLDGFRCDFVQIWRPARFGGAVEERGSLWVRKPGMARWEYFQPEHKIALVTPERETWFYMPDEAQAVHGRLGEDLPPHLALLFGKEGLEDGFRVADLERPGQGDPTESGEEDLSVLTLEALEAGPGYRRLRITVDESDLTLSSVVVEGIGGEQTEYIFLNFREGAAAPVGVFRFEPPEGVDVVEEGVVREES